MSKSAADPNDPLVIVNKAAQKLRALDARQRVSHETWKAAWKQRRAVVLTDLTDEEFGHLKTFGKVSKWDETIRAEAFQLKAAQESTGNAEAQPVDVDADGEA